jgi:hypothetical protein
MSYQSGRMVYEPSLQFIPVWEAVYDETKGIHAYGIDVRVLIGEC